MKSHALPVYKKNRIASLLCIFETIIQYLSLTQIDQIPIFLPLTLLDLCSIEAFVNM